MRGAALRTMSDVGPELLWSWRFGVRFKMSGDATWHRGTFDVGRGQVYGAAGEAISPRAIRWVRFSPKDEAVFPVDINRNAGWMLLLCVILGGDREALERDIFGEPRRHEQGRHLAAVASTREWAPFDVTVGAALEALEEWRGPIVSTAD